MNTGHRTSYILFCFVLPRHSSTFSTSFVLGLALLVFLLAFCSTRVHPTYWLHRGVNLRTKFLVVNSFFVSRVSSTQQTAKRAKSAFEFVLQQR